MPQLLNLTSGTDSHVIFSPSLFSETVLHSEISLCIENQLGPNISLHFFDELSQRFTNSLDLEPWLTVVRKSVVTDWELVIENGLNVTLTTSNLNATGQLIFKKCRKDWFTTLENNKTSVLHPLRSWEHTLHVPFVLSSSQNATKYVDFSTILPRRILAGRNWQIKAFCLNATVVGNINVHMSRCKSSPRFTVQVNSTTTRQLVRYWNEMISLEDECPIEEESLTDHLWMEFESIDHNGLGEVIFYNCQHTWRRDEEGEEQVQIVADLPKLESVVWSFDYVVLPNRQNVHFAPIKHMIDTALVTGAEIQLSLIYSKPHMISFSSCFKSRKHEIEIDSPKSIMNLTKHDLQVLSDFSNDLNCPEDKTHHGFYMNVGADREIITGTALFRLIDPKGAQTPEGRLQADVQSTVAFNILKGHRISRNVNLQRLIRQGAENVHIELNQVFNCTGLVQLYISRCEFSPKLKLFGAMKMGSVRFEKREIDYIFQLYNVTSCLSDFQDPRYEYRNKDKFGLYLHIEALEDTIGYTATYESFKAKLIYHELNEEYTLAPREHRSQTGFRVFKASEVVSEIVIAHLLERAIQKPAVSLRLYVSSSGPMEFAFSQCRNKGKRDWQKLDGQSNNSLAAWYTFDSEGVDLLRAYSDSPNCENKPYSILFIHVKTQQRINVQFEFSLFNGTDLNVVYTCPIAMKLKLQEAELYNKVLFLLIEIALVVVVILGLFTMIVIVKKMLHKQENIDYKTMEMTSLEQMVTGSPVSDYPITEVYDLL
ncbi:unnamed protein product [Caenorhabditis brenneri]